MANHILENTNLPTSSQQELEIEYEKWKSTVVSILDNMEDGSNIISGRQNQKGKSRDDRSRLEHLNSMQSEAMALKKLIEQRPTNMKKQRQLCHKHSKSLRHKVTKTKETSSDAHDKYNKNNSYGIQYSRND